MTETTLDVKYPGADDSLMDIGLVYVDERGEITLLDASPGFRTTLENIVSTVNAQEELRIKAPPPPDAAPMSVYRRTVARDAPDLLDVLCEYMEQKYNLFLVNPEIAPSNS